MGRAKIRTQVPRSEICSRITQESSESGQRRLGKRSNILKIIKKETQERGNENKLLKTTKRQLKSDGKHERTTRASATFRNLLKNPSRSEISPEMARISLNKAQKTGRDVWKVLQYT